MTTSLAGKTGNLTDEDVSAAASVGRGVARKDDRRLVFTDLSREPLIYGVPAIGEGLYWPSIIRVEGRLRNPLARYYCYFSTNHSAGGGGIFMAYANSLAGPWTMYSSSPIYLDSVYGAQTETPCAVWDPVSEQIYLYYHNNSGGWNSHQQSHLATSTDGINYTRFGKVWDSVQDRWPGDGHNGYGNVIRFGRDQWIAQHLQGGTDFSFVGWSYSHDGINWMVDPFIQVNKADATWSNNYKLTFMHLFRWQSRLWALANWTEPGSNTSVRDNQIVAGPFRSDLRGFVARPEVAWVASKSWQRTDNSSISIFVDDDGAIYMPYINNDNFGIARGEFLP